ncbi:ATP-binding domain-containing protein [Streptomyces sp. CB03911]|uniref:ATP-binding domain-containing protein n=1 Tax=Streptomyces sp. CB03911 TaxID=1804758 RepID=UPI000AD71B63|nr:ATP-binding domain-containing protein [Streptomyces sp. CB03911]
MSDTENSAPGGPADGGRADDSRADDSRAGGSPAQDGRADTVAALAEKIRAIGQQSTAGPDLPPADRATDGAAPDAAARRAPQPDEQRAQALRATAEVLTAGGAPADFAAAAVAELGEGAAELLRADPWAVLALPGVRPEQADGFARGLLGAEAGPGDTRRARALVPWLLEQAALRGDSAVEIGEVATGLERLGLPEPAAALQAVVEDGLVMPFQDELTGPEARAAATGSDEDDEPPTRTLLALERLALAEESLADGLVRVMSTFAPGEDVETAGQDTGTAGQDEADDEAADLGGEPSGTGAESSEEEAGPSDAGAEPATAGGEQDDAPATEPGTEPAADAAGLAEAATETAPPAPGPAAWEAAAATAPSSSAAALIRAVADSALVAHTGGEASRAEPAALLHAARGLGLRAWAATWTDQGRQSLAGLLPAGAAPDVVTLAELLSGTAGPGRSGDGTLALDLLIVLDAPLLDAELAATLLESLADGTRLVLSGDPGQLWSAGPGRFFADLLAAKVCPAVASRTPDFGPIGELVSAVGIGELQPVEAPDKEVVILTAKDGGEAVHRAVQLLTDSIPRALGIPAEQVVLLTPGHGGSAGTRALNAAAKARLNPGPGRFGGFDPGDRVVHSPAPGVIRPGRVLDGDATGLHLELSDGTRSTVAPAEAAKLRHGWALTVHQAVGRRWPGAVVVLPDDAGAGLTRQWVYTAFGRAERHLSVVHAAGPALPQAVAERPARPRTTRLRTILAENAEPAY